MHKSRRTTTTILSLLVLFQSLASATAQPTRTTDPLEVLHNGHGLVTMLIIPCMSCSANAWEGFMERNRDRYNMYAVTIPGYGGTPVPKLPMNTDGTPWRDNALRKLSTLIKQEKLEDVVVVGHSWGTMVAVQLAARHPGVVTQLVAVDGTIESTSWAPSTAKERLERANEIVESWSEKLRDAESWRKFNRVRTSKGDLIPRDEVVRSIRLYGSFMATPREVLLQYWRENVLVDLTSDLQRLKIPILDIKALRGSDIETKRAQHLEDLAKAGASDRVKTVFFYDTRHFVADHRPEAFDHTLAAFIAGRKVEDYRSKPE